MLIRVAGCDPALRNTGLVKGTLDLDTGEFTIEDLLLIETEATSGKTIRVNSSDLHRAQTLARGIQDFTKDVSIIFVELPVGSQSSRAMASYGICIGLLSSLSIPLIEVTPIEVKVSLCGSKTATKQQMIDKAHSLYPDAPWLYQKRKGQNELVGKNEHLADSIGTVHAGVNTPQFKQAAAISRG